MLICVLYTPAPPDAPAEELDGLVQRDAVSQALEALGHRVVQLPFVSDLQEDLRFLRELSPDCVFNLVEAVAGEDQLQVTAPAVLETLALPYTGCSLEAMALCADKLAAKRRMLLARLPTAAWTDSQRLPVKELLGQTVIWKHRSAHASVGLDEESLTSYPSEAEIIRQIKQRGPGWYAEQFIEGREFNISLLQQGSRARMLPAAEIDFSHFPEGKPRLVGYRAKWDPTSFEYHHTNRLFDFPESDAQLLELLEKLSLACWEVFSLRGYARVDFRVDREERPWILEINTNPCLSPDAGFAAAAARAGLDYPALIGTLLEAAICR